MSSRPPNKHDVELRRLDVRGDVAKVFAYGVVVAVCLAASALPLLVIVHIIQPLAGKKTIINANLLISVSISASVAINGIQWIKGWSRKQEVRRLRALNQEYEGRLGL
jgi:hypothetical protein